MAQAITMIYVSITNFVLISLLEKDHSIIETRRLKNVISFQTIVLLKKIIMRVFHQFCGSKMARCLR